MCGALSWRLRLLLLALANLLRCAAGAGVFELQILQFSNERAEVANGGCCAGSPRPVGPLASPPARCSTPCRTRFTLCLKEYQSAAAPGACSFGRAASPVLGTDSFTLAEPLYTLALPFSFRWTRSFTLILQAYDDYEYPEPDGGLIVEAWWSGIVEPSAAWHALQHAANTTHASVAYRVRVLCQPNYYNTTCTTFCRPRDDKFGHYSCTDHGDKQCLPGWQGDNCEKPVCKEGCHPTHGRCDKPGDCDCRPGWRGELCSQCQPYPGCKHGYCNGSSWDCTCDTNWGGILCDQDLNYCGTHEPCQHGGTCENTAPDQYLCRCAEGFSGVDCERVDNPCAPQPCVHGECSLSGAARGFACACERGWGGALCDLDVDDCASEPCRHGATCRDRLDAFQCECTPGWTGPTCTEDVNECVVEGAAEGALGPCVNAALCNNTAGGYRCACLAGWTGRDCETNVDDCAGQCLNGATCIDLVDDFHCACAPGWAGRTCARDVDECAPRPCRHGGECVDLLDGYRCICPVGFSGTDCELTSCYGRYCADDRDHCAGAPCANGAACYTAQSDYYCHCTPGWTGKNCTARAARDHSEMCGAGVCVHGRCVRVGQSGGLGGTGGPRCVCEPPYSGALCDQVDPCAGVPCRNNATCIHTVSSDFTCLCRDGWTGKTCSVRVEEIDRCPSACANGGTCVRDGITWRCVCATGWTGAACTEALVAEPTCPCLAGGTCVASASAAGWACACPEGRTGARCELAVDLCSSSPCHNGGRCVSGAGGGWWACECVGGWSGDTCSVPACSPACPVGAACVPDAHDPQRPPRCVCPPPPKRAARRCLELLAGLGAEGEEAADGGEGDDGGEGGTEGHMEDADACGAHNGTWWWGCNACWCEGGAPACTRLWCGLPDCRVPGAQPCRTDEVCVPAAPALCLRAPCAPLGECRRVSGRRVEPPALPAPAACWPGTRAPAAPLGGGCARAALQLARERLARGAHVERACGALRRALAAALAARSPPAPPLALLCDLAPDDDDVLDLALWIGEEVGAEAGARGAALGAAVRALSELVARRRLAHHPLLGAALRLTVPRAPPPPPPPPQTPQPPPPPADRAAPERPAALPVALAVGALGALAAAALAALLVVRRRRAADTRAADRSRRCDEEKSNNLQNEENLRRYANPLREDGAADELPRAHSLYKAQNADARNATPPRDKELTKRALPPPEPPPVRRAPPERLTVLV